MRELWLVDAERQNIEVRQQAGEELGEGRVFGAIDAIESSVLPGLSFLVADVFEPVR